MADLSVEDFRQGLDTRRPAISGVPGSLVVLNNAHITRGGEIAKRRAFVPAYALPAGTVGLASIKGNLTVFGSGPRPAALASSLRYERLVHPSGAALSRVLDWDTFGGKIYASALFEDGSIHHYHGGEIVGYWRDFGGVSQIASNEQTASYLAGLIDAEPTFSASATLNRVRVSGPADGSAFTYAVQVLGATDQAITASPVQAGSAALPEAPAQGSFTITGGSVAGAGTVESVAVDGVALIGAPVAHTGDNIDTAQAVAAAINAHASSPDYTATTSGATVIITAPPGFGAALNDKAVAVAWSGDLLIGGTTNMAGGQNARGAVPQVVDFTITGSYQDDIVYQIVLDGKALSKYGSLPGRGVALKSYRNKIYSTVQDTLYFSGVAEPTAWDPLDGDKPGAGFITLTNWSSESESLNALAAYGDLLAVFGSQTVYLLATDPDPAKNQVGQIFANTGTPYPGSIQSYGAQDVFYLDTSGLRSLRARQYTDSPAVQDVGSPIDSLIQSTLGSLTQGQVLGICSLIDPDDGRYWLLLGSKAYVLSTFGGAGISAWSTYDLPGDVEAAVVSNRRAWLRCGDTIYLYGGESGNAYDASRVEVLLPYLDFGAPSAYKRITGADFALTGTWTAELLTDPRRPAVRHRVGTISEHTFQSGTIALGLRSTHIAPRLVCEQDGPATLSKIIIHYNPEGVPA